MYLATRGDGSYFLAEKVNGKVKYIKNIGKDPTRYNEMRKEGKGIAAILERNPILVESLGSAVKRIYSADNAIRLMRQETPAIPTGDVYYADPPWKYDFSETITREIENQYPTMELEDIKSLIIPAPDDAALFLWATAPKLIEALEVMKSWGFTYKTQLVWDKEKIGMGYWFRGQHEILMVGTKGNMSPPETSGRIPSVYRQPRTGHSVKPPDFHWIIESMLPGLRYVELFARKPYNEKWAVWGNEV